MSYTAKINDHWVHYGEDTRIAKRHLEDLSNEEADELFDKAKENQLGEKFRVEGRAYRVIYQGRDGDGRRRYMIDYLGRD